MANVYFVAMLGKPSTLAWLPRFTLTSGVGDLSFHILIPAQLSGLAWGFLTALSASFLPTFLNGPQCSSQNPGPELSEIFLAKCSISLLFPSAPL